MGEREMTMVERVARNLAAVHFGRRQHVEACTKEERVQFLVNTHWRNHEPDARAAIEAMSEPTKAVREALWQHTLGCDERDADPYRAWDAGLDAALSETPSPSNPSAYQEP